MPGLLGSTGGFHMIAEHIRGVDWWPMLYLRITYISCAFTHAGSGGEASTGARRGS